ncbi:hypothetical protein ACFE04_017144 [Oxalis oulophora]
MPKRPVSHQRGGSSNTRRPLTFSPFARTIAKVAASRMVRKRPEFQSKKGNKAAVENEFVDDSDSEEENAESDSSEDEEFDGVVQADFAFFDPKPSDFQGVKILLQSYLDDKQWDLSGFVDLILEQTTVGTVIKIEDDEDEGLFSVISALNLGRYKDHKCMEELKEYLLKGCQEENIKNNLKSFVGEEAHSVGLIVSQRVTNLPPQLLPPFYDGLFDEISWATEDEPTKELQNSFRFKSYLILTKVYKHKNPGRKTKHGEEEESVIYVKPEEEIFHKLSSWSFNFPLTQPVSSQELKNYRLTGLVMAIEADKITSFRQQLNSLVNE